MAQSDKFGKSRKRKLLLASDIYELDAEDRSPVDSPRSPDEDVIVLDESQESASVFENSELDNLSVCEAVNFDGTVGPGVAPEGYILIDEDIDVEEKDAEPRDDEDAKVPPRPVFKVMFRDEDVAREYKKQVGDFLQSLVSPNTIYCQDSDPSNLVLEIWDHGAMGVKKMGEIVSEREESQKTIDDELFMVDTKPKLIKDDFDIPTYGKKFDKVLVKPIHEPVTDAKESVGPKLSCFNCLGNHNMRDCTEKRNYANINKNRKEFTAKMGPRNARYHLEDDQRFAHFVPGQLSKNLRKALGLRDNDLPRHIYRMRTLGYPPGWMEEARVQHSGLTLFDSEEPAVTDPKIGTMGDTRDRQEDQFDTKMIHDFPGFNIPPPPGTRDDYKHLRVPPMLPEQSKETMLSRLVGRKADEGYKRKRMKITRTAAATDASVGSSEMELVDVEDDLVETVPLNGLFIPPLPKDTSPKPPEPPSVLEDSDIQCLEPESPDSVNQSTAPSSRANSPSLSDLECAKKQLLNELDDSSLLSSPGTPLKLGSSSSVQNTPRTEMPPPNTDYTPQNSRTQSMQSTPNTNPGTVKSVDLGTPILQSTSPYNKLPSSEKFSKDICDIINFENLPDSTGKYEQMSGILQKVRCAVARLQQE